MEELLNKKIGVLGGGQLGKMLCQASATLGIQLHVMDKSKSFPAGLVAPSFYEGDIQNYNDVMSFGKDKDILTIEIEGVHTGALKELESLGKLVFPQPHIVEMIKDKGSQKLFYQENNMPTSPFIIVDNWDEIKSKVIEKTIKIPFVQKARSGGYDGRGVHIVRTVEDLDNLLQTPSLIEEIVNIEKEISVIVARSSTGEIHSFPVVDMEFHPTANLVEYLYSPSSCPVEIQNHATTIAETVAEKMGIVGLLAVELFYDAEGNILINEVAPRPHNSGHHTIEANVTSQFEQHIRAITGLPLGNPEIIIPSVMTNILGEQGFTGPAVYQNMIACLETPGVHVHLYGKKETKPFRKMGHITIVDKDLQEAIEKAKKVKSLLKVIT